MPRTILAMSVFAKTRVQTSAVALKNVALILFAQKVNALDDGFQVIVIQTRFRISAAAGTRLFSGKKHTVYTHCFKQQLQGELVVIAGVKVQAFESVIKELHAWLANRP